VYEKELHVFFTP